MKYNKQEIFKQAKEAIIKYKLIFIEEILGYIPMSKQTLYDYFPVNSDELDELKNLINTNKLQMKNGLRKKWYDNNNATTQIALYRLLATKEETEALSLNKQDISITNGEVVRIEIPEGKRIE